MDAIQKYEFDRQGYIVIPGMLSADEVGYLATAVDWLEEHALAHIDQPPRKFGWMKPYLSGTGWHQNPDYGYHAQVGPRPNDRTRGEGQTLIVEDWFNADPAFDVLVNHAPTMDLIRDVIQSPVRINNSELRFRYPGNNSPQHFGGPADHKYRYSFNRKGIDAMMVRMVYFIHDVNLENGPLCVVPGTHKTHLPSPYACPPEEEPGMVGLEVKAGDAVLFTENLRHGGFTNVSDEPRRTLHVGYGPYWMFSQNDATRDEQQYITPQTWERYDAEQRALFVIDPDQMLAFMRRAAEVKQPADA